jgi:hypothetical protein
MKYTIYNSTTGEISSVLSTHDPKLAVLNIGTNSYVEGEYNSQTHYIHNGQAVAKPDNPSTETTCYTFDYASKTWTIDHLQTGHRARHLRNQLLSQIDRINPVWYASLSQEQQQAVVAYRQQLLAVPQQTGFPTVIDWPAKPTWL